MKDKNFGETLKTAISDAKLKKKEVAEKAGMDSATLYRTLSGDVGASKGKRLALVQTVNSLAGRVVIGERQEFESSELARLFNNLPGSVQADVLIIVKALHGKYGLENL